MKEFSDGTLLLHYGRERCYAVQTRVPAGNECREV